MTDAIRFRILKNLVTDALREIQHANPADRIALITGFTACLMM